MGDIIGLKPAADNERPEGTLTGRRAAAQEGSGLSCAAVRLSLWKEHKKERFDKQHFFEIC